MGEMECLMLKGNRKEMAAQNLSLGVPNLRGRLRASAFVLGHDPGILDRAPRELSAPQGVGFSFCPSPHLCSVSLSLSVSLK